jgi:hypothetical protein
MSTVLEIEQAVRRLSEQELAAFRAWFAEYDARLWDEQFERDVAAGKLNALENEAIDDQRSGRCTEL